MPNACLLAARVMVVVVMLLLLLPLPLLLSHERSCGQLCITSLFVTSPHPGRLR